MIKRLWVKNFRSLGDVDIQLEPLTVLVGANGAGKSNLLDALRFVSEAVRLGLATAVTRRQGIRSLQRLTSAGYITDDVEIGLEITVGDLFVAYSFDLTGETTAQDDRAKGQGYLKRERCHIQTIAGESLAGFETAVGEWVLRPLEMAPPIQANSLVLPLLAGVEPYKTVYNYLAGMSFYANFANQTIRQPQKPAAPYPLDEQGENLASTLKELQKSKNQGFKRALQAAIPEIVGYKVGPVQGYLLVGFRHKMSAENGRQAVFSLSDESEGTLRVLTILTALYQEPPRTFIGIEEPELHIHPGILAVLWEEFSDAAKQSQILLTTHSPDLLDMCQAEQLRVVEKIDGVTYVGPVEEAQKQIIRQGLFAPGQLLQAQGLHRAETA